MRFNPQKAAEAADKALQYTRDILKVDPLDAKTAKENPGVASLFGVLADVIEKPEQYKLYVTNKGETFINEKGEKVYLKGGELVGKNDAGIPNSDGSTQSSRPEKSDRSRQADQQPSDRRSHDRRRNSLDQGLSHAIRRCSRSSEQGMGKYGSHAGAALKATGYSAAIGGSMLGRHFGYQALSGAEEKLG